MMAYLQELVADFGRGVLSYDELWTAIEHNLMSEPCGV